MGFDPVLRSMLEVALRRQEAEWSLDPWSTIDHRSPVKAKIGVFRSLFRGREDV